MRILIYSDNHWCQYSSIVRKRGEKYSLRLENQIESVSWAENLSMDAGCEKIIQLGEVIMISLRALHFLNFSLLYLSKLKNLMVIQLNFIKM